MPKEVMAARGAGPSELMNRASAGKGVVKMFRANICAAVLLMLASSFALVSCAGDDGSPVSDASLQIEDELSRAPEVQELFEIRDAIAARALAMNVTGERIRAAGCDTDAMNELLGYSAEEARERFARINVLIETLYDRYPSLRHAESAVPPECETCDSEAIAERWERISSVLAAETGKSAGALDAPAKAPLKCNMQKLIMGFYACAQRAGASFIVYLMCSYVVFCASCDGGVSEYIC